MSILELGLLVVFSVLSLAGLKFLHSSGSAIRFRQAPVSEVPLWSGFSVLVLLISFFIIPALIMRLLEAYLDIGLHSEEGKLSASSMTGGLLLGGGLIVYAIWRLVVVNLNQPTSTLGFCSAPFANLVPLVLFYVLSFSPFYLIAYFWIVLLQWLGYEPMSQGIVQRIYDALARGNLLEIALMVFGAVVLAPLLEEIIFRGFIFGLLKSRCGVFPALVFSSAVFAAIHFSLSALLPLFFVGLALGYVYHRTRSLYFPFLFHAVFNGVNIIFLWLKGAS